MGSGCNSDLRAAPLRLTPRTWTRTEERTRPPGGWHASARYGDAGQRKLLVALAIGAGKILSDTKFRAAPEGARITQHAPLRLLGPGDLVVRGHVEFGVPTGQHLLQGVFLAARTRASSIFIDDGAVITNGVAIVSEGAGIRIGRRVLIGPGTFCADSNFHDLAVARRRSPDPAPTPVEIGDDVLIGEGVKILKGARIGTGSVVAAGAVLLPGFQCPVGATVAGNPATVIRIQA